MHISTLPTTGSRGLILMDPQGIPEAIDTALPEDVTTLFKLLIFTGREAILDDGLMAYHIQRPQFTAEELDDLTDQLTTPTTDQLTTPIEPEDPDDEIL